MKLCIACLIVLVYALIPLPVAAAPCVAPSWDTNTFWSSVSSIPGDPGLVDMSVDNGTEPVRYTVEEGQLPIGTYLVPPSGLIVGKPLAGAIGTTSVRYRATNGCGSVVSPLQTWFVSPQVAFNTGEDFYNLLPHIVAARLYDWHAEFGGPIKITGQLPVGSNVDLKTGVISGVLTTRGQYLFTVTPINNRSIPFLVIVKD